MRLHEIMPVDSAALVERRLVLDPDRDLVVWENPSATEFSRLLAEFGVLRGSSGPNDPLYVWDANTWVHHTVQKYVGHMPYYLYFSRTKKVPADEWQKYMKRIGAIFVGVKYAVTDERNREIPRPDIPLSHPMVRRALGTPD